MDLDPAEQASLEAELEELLEEQSRELDRPMRGAVRDQLRRKYERLEARLRERIAMLRDGAAPAEATRYASGDQIAGRGKVAETRIFDEQADRSSAWYDTPAQEAAYAQELDAFRPLLTCLPRPWLEVGAGTGRFERALGVEFGVNPARGPLAIAADRGVRVATAAGEALPFPRASSGAVAPVVTLCFVSDPLRVLREAGRVVRSVGGLVLGIILAEGLLGQEYKRMAAAGHLYQRHAHFFTRGELARLLARTDFRLERSRTALGRASADASLCDGDDPDAGFTALLALGTSATTVSPCGTSPSPRILDP